MVGSAGPTRYCPEATLLGGTPRRLIASEKQSSSRISRTEGFMAPKGWRTSIDCGRHYELQARRFTVYPASQSVSMLVLVWLAGMLEGRISRPSPGTDHSGVLVELVVAARFQSGEAGRWVDRRFPVGTAAGRRLFRRGGRETSRIAGRIDTSGGPCRLHLPPTQSEVI